jgi:DNA-directed RNA polymerase subunit L
MNEMKKKEKMKEKIEEKKDLMIVKLQKEEDTLMKIIRKR